LSFAILWLVLMAGVFYLLIWRPQQRRLSHARALQHSLHLGDEVITTSGIYGTITALRDEFIELEIAPKVTVRVARGAVGGLVTSNGEDVDVDATPASGDEETG